MLRLTDLRLTALGMLLTVGVLLHAQPLSAQCKLDCDFKEGVTFLRATIWDTPGDCDNLEGRIDPQHHGIGPRGPESFVRGVCLFERLRRNKLSPKTTDARRRLPIVAAIDELQKAQSVPMLAAQRTAAALFEGLMHCAELKQLPDREDTRTRRCAHRAMAKTSFARVDHAGLDLRYPDANSAAIVDQQVVDMLECQATQLHDAQASACGVMLSASDAELEQVATDVAKQALPRFFGADPGDAQSTAIPHVVALVNAKITEADQASKGAAEAYEKLADRNDALTKNYTDLEQLLCTQSTCAPGAIGLLLNKYESAVLSVTRYLTFIQEFMDGFFQTGDTKENVRDALRQNVPEAVNTVAELTPKHAALTGLKQDLERLAGDPTGAETVRKACKHLFCDILADGPRSLDIACAAVDGTRKQELKAFNPLCKGNAGTQIIDNGATTASLCQEVGFDFAVTSCDD